MNDTIYGILATKNEQAWIRTCLLSLQFCGKIIIVDNGSTDKTLEIAREFSNVTVIEVTIDNPHPAGEQRQRAAELVPDDGWMYFADGDEVVTPELADEIVRVVHGGGDTTTAYQIPRVNVLLGQPTYHGGWYPDYQLRLIKKSSLVQWVYGPFDVPPVLHSPAFDYLKNSIAGSHDKPLLTADAKVGQLTYPYWHFTHRSITEMTTKSVRFNEADVIKLVQNSGTRRPPAWVLVVYPLKEFIRRYFWKRGFLDGRIGFIEAYFQAFSIFFLQVRYWEETLPRKLPDEYANYREEWQRKLEPKT